MTIRWIQGFAAVGAVLVLTGASGEGCGGGSSGGGSTGGTPTEPPPEPCPPGSHVDVVCYESDCNEPPTCIEECVPDEICPDGSEPQLVCGGGVEPMPEPQCDDQGNCVDPMPPDQPPPDECWYECIPPNNCGPGFYEEWICEGYGGGSDPGGGMDDPGQPDCGGMEGETDCQPPDPGEPICYPICVPIDDTCGPGYHEEFICYGGGPEEDGGDGDGNGMSDPSEPPGDQVCELICVPDSQCPPGTYNSIVCSEDGVCWEECVPYDDEPLPG